jgi:hypothetical protein
VGLFPDDTGGAEPPGKDGSSRRVVEEASLQADKQEHVQESSSSTDTQQATGSNNDTPSSIPSFDDEDEEPPLGTFNCWIGSSDQSQKCRIDDPSVDDVLERDGMALVYYVSSLIFLFATITTYSLFMLTKINL